MLHLQNNLPMGKHVPSLAGIGYASRGVDVKKILVASDDGALRRLVAACLRKHNYHIIELDTPRDSVSVTTRECPDLLILDQYANGGEPVEGCKVLLISNNPNMCHDCVKEWGGDGFLRRPFTPVLLRDTIEGLLSPPTQTVKNDDL